MLIFAMCAALAMEPGGLQAAKAAKPKVELPANVAKAFKTSFPDAQIQKLDVDVENGVTVYDIEFRNGTLEQETDITADGTVLEVSLVVDAKTVPEAAMKALVELAGQGKISRIEKVEIAYETKAGKTVKLPQSATRFEAEVTQGGKISEIVVTPAGAQVKE